MYNVYLKTYIISMIWKLVHKIPVIFFFFRPVKKAKVGPKTPGTAKKKSMNDHFELCTLLVHVHV